MTLKQAQKEFKKLIESGEYTPDELEATACELSKAADRELEARESMVVRVTEVADKAIEALDMDDAFGNDIDARHACEEDAWHRLHGLKAEITQRLEKSVWGASIYQILDDEGNQLGLVQTHMDAESLEAFLTEALCATESLDECLERYDVANPKGLVIQRIYVEELTIKCGPNNPL